MTDEAGWADWRQYVGIGGAGVAVFVDTNLPIYEVLDKLAARMPEADILAAYPDDNLTPDHITAALRYASSFVRVYG